MFKKPEGRLDKLGRGRCMFWIPREENYDVRDEKEKEWTDENNSNTYLIAELIDFMKELH